MGRPAGVPLHYSHSSCQHFREKYSGWESVCCSYLRNTVCLSDEKTRRFGMYLALFLPFGVLCTKVCGSHGVGVGSVVISSCL